MVGHRNQVWMLLIAVSGLLVFIAGKSQLLNAVRASADLGLIFLIATLLPKNLLKLKLPVMMRFRSWLIPLVREQRSLGITAGLLFVLHAFLALRRYNLIPPTPDFIFSQPIILGLASLLILTAMLLTSSQQSYRLLGRRWKSLHSLVWLLAPFGLIHSTLTSTLYNGKISLFPLLGFSAVILFVIGEYTLSLARKQPSESARRHALLIGVGSLVAVVVWRFS
ncbi:MAG: hypothetical protein WEA04_02075 [Candidatus Andersenbacteria bacterium]